MPPTPPRLSSAKTRSPHAPRAPCWNAIFTGSTTPARPAEPRRGFARRGQRRRGPCHRARGPRVRLALWRRAAKTSTGGRARTPWWLLKRPQRATRRGQRRLDAAAARADAAADRARSARCASQRHTRARAPACAHAHAGRLSRSPGAIEGPSSARGGGGGARSLGRSRARGVALVMAVGVGGRLHRTPRASRAPRVTRAHAHIITASRASSPFTAPPAHDRHARAAAAAALARSLARSIARTRRGVRGGGGVQLHRASRASRTPRVTRAYVRASSPISAPPAHNRHARATAAAALDRSLDRSIARTRCGVGGGGGVQLHRASRA